VKVVSGQDMRMISQAYGIKLKKLYKYNGYRVGQQPKVGEQLRLKQWGVFEKKER
jgi:LysM repeat protein